MGKEQDCKNDLALKKCQTELLEIKNWWHSKRREISQKRGENKNNELNDISFGIHFSLFYTMYIVQ